MHRDESEQPLFFNTEFYLKVVRARVETDSDGKGVFKDIGRVVETKKGTMLKLNTIPVGWDGWAYIMEPLEKKEE